MRPLAVSIFVCLLICLSVKEFCVGQAPKGKPLPLPTPKELQAMLAIPIKLDGLNKNTVYNFKEMIGYMTERFQSSGRNLRILVDTEAFRAESSEEEDILASPIKIQFKQTTMPAGLYLAQVLEKLPIKAGYLFRKDFIEITTQTRLREEIKKLQFKP